MEATINVEKTAKSLERKTKKELVEIILRKDAVERNLRADIKGTEKTLEITRNNLELTTANLSDAKLKAKKNFTEFEIACDELASLSQRYKTLININKICYTVLVIGLILLLIFW